MESSLTLYKLIILYMLKKVSFPLTNAQISDFILGQEYTNYFHLQQAISEMLESGLLTVETVRNASHYRATERGEETLSFFEKEISDAIKNDIEKYLTEHAYEMRNEVSTLADYYITPEHEFAVRCQVKEKNTHLIDLTITVPTKEAANAICNNWSVKSQEVYAYLMEELLR